MTPTSIYAATETATVCQAFQASAERCASEPALRGANGVEWTWKQYADQVRAAAAGLRGLGVSRGDAIACWVSNRPEFHVADTAAIHLGAAPFSIYPTYTVEQAEEVIADSGARVLVTEQRYLESACAVRARANTALETIVVVDAPAAADALGWAELIDLGGSGFDLEDSAAAVGPDDLLTLIYTSGTTGAPKGVQLTHGNVMAQLAAMERRLELTDGLTAISWLPMAHIAERLCTHYFPILHGWQVTTCEDPRAIGSVLREVRPEFFFSPPRLWEKLRTGILARTANVLDDPAAAATARAAVGLDRARVAVVGAAPCPREVIEFWRGLGVPLLEVYGLSETTGVATVNPPDGVRVGTVGTPLDGVEVRLSHEKEVMIRGPVVMAGYRNHPRQDRGGDRRRRLVAHRRCRRVRPRRIPPYRRPDQGADHQRRR